jgi:hypothetical protein
MGSIQYHRNQYPRVFNYDKKTTTHLIDLKNFLSFPKTFPLRIERRRTPIQWTKMIGNGLTVIK